MGGREESSLSAAAAGTAQPAQANKNATYLYTAGRCLILRDPHRLGWLPRRQGRTRLWGCCAVLLVLQTHTIFTMLVLRLLTTFYFTIWSGHAILLNSTCWMISMQQAERCFIGINTTPRYSHQAVCVVDLVFMLFLPTNLCQYYNQLKLLGKLFFC